MCLSNVGFVDPDNKSKFGHGSTLQRKVFEYYFDKQEILHKITNSIISISKIKFPIDYCFEDSIYGILLPSYHFYLEKKNITVQMVKNEISLRRQSCCNLCGRDLNKNYTIGNELIEIHISAPLYENNERMVVSPSDLLILCPTCHKLAHHKLESFEAKHLQGYIIQ